MARGIKKIVAGRTKYDGAGVKLTRVLAHGNVYDFDPFLLLDAFDSRDPEDYIKGFPWHPHRGIETVTYLLSGELVHGDSLGNRGVIRDGECQWMTAGNGIMHQEMPQPSERMYGVQLWINLPRAHKMTDPKYNDITRGMVARVDEEGAAIRVVAGRYRDVTAAMRGEFVDANFIDVSLAPGAEWHAATRPDTTVFAYTLEGSARFGGSDGEQEARRCVLFEDGDEVAVKAGERGARFLLLEGAPLREPIAWGGPIVMNTEEELKAAFCELNEGTFIKR